MTHSRFILRFFLPLFAVLIMSANLYALSPREELLAISQRYSKAQGFSMNISVSIFQNSKDVVPQQQYKGVVKKSSCCYYSNLMGQTSLVNDKCQIVIDDQLKVIYYDGQKIDAPKHNKNSYDLAVLLDSLVIPGNKIQFISGGNENVLEIIPVNGDFYKRMLITYMPSSHEITDVTYFFDETEEGSVGKVKIGYSQILLGDEPPEISFSEKTIIIKKNNIIQPAPAYAGYHVVDITEPVLLPVDNH